MTIKEICMMNKEELAVATNAVMPHYVVIKKVLEDGYCYGEFHMVGKNTVRYFKRKLKTYTNGRQGFDFVGRHYYIPEEL